MRDEDPVVREVLRERIARHGFASRPAGDPATAAALVCGIQAQDGAASRLGVRARSRGATDARVLAAIADRSVVRTWLMRNTIHLVAAADVRWLVALLGPMIRRRFETVRWPGLGLTPEVLARVEAAAPDVLAGRALTRAEFAAALAEQGVPLDKQGQASHALLYLSTLGMVCRGVDRSRDATFVLLDEWLPGSAPGPRGDDALAEFARRYFTAFAPATGADFTTWSGLPSSRAIELIRDELTQVDVLGRPGFRLGSVEPRRGVRLLSAFDNYLVGYRDRSALIDADRVPEVYVGGIIRPTLLVDGRVAGRWRLVRGRADACVELLPFGPLSRTVRAAIERETADLGRFLGLPANLRIAED